ncbi:MAG: IclR family transcriptional regulator [bacterium]|nr:IclR family transcriptional regulator [bacterium]
MLGTILKAGQVFALFNGERPEWGVSDIAHALGIAKSSAHDLVASMAQIGLLTQGEDGRYRLGWKLVELSEILLETTELRAVARPILERINDTYQETIRLAILDHGKVCYVDTLDGMQPIRVAASGLGSHLYPHCSGVGKVLLAHQPSTLVERTIAEQGLPRFTESTITTLEALRAELDATRQRGWGIDNGEIIADLRCIAAPIRNHSGRVVAAVSMSVPAFRFERSQDALRGAVMRAGDEISLHLGYRAKGVA